MIMDKDIDYYLGVFEKMKRALMRGVKAPHKPLLLLAILNLCQRGTIKDNHIVLSSELVGEFKRGYGDCILVNRIQVIVFLLQRDCPWIFLIVILLNVA